MCHECCEKLESTYNFYTTVIKTDNEFKEKLCWMQKRTKEPSKINGVPMVALKNFNIKSEVEETAESTEPNRRNELITIVHESTSQNGHDDQEIFTPTEVQNQEVNNNSKNDVDDDDDNNNNVSLKAKKTIESVKKNLFSSPKTHTTTERKKNPVRPRDIENEIHDRQVQSNFVLESPSDNTSNSSDDRNLRKNVLSPVVLLKSKTIFENRSPLRRPRNSLTKVTYFRKTDNQNVANIVRMLKTDSKLREGLQVKLKRLDLAILNEKNKKLDKEKKKINGNIKRENNNLKSINFNTKRTLRISRKGSVQKPKNGRIMKKNCFTNGNEINNCKKKLRRSMIDGELLNGVVDDGNLEEKKKKDVEPFKIQCKICEGKFVSNEIYKLHPCYCKT